MFWGHFYAKKGHNCWMNPWGKWGLCAHVPSGRDTAGEGPPCCQPRRVPTDWGPQCGVPGNTSSLTAASNPSLSAYTGAGQDPEPPRTIGTTPPVCQEGSG